MAKKAAAATTKRDKKKPLTKSQLYQEMADRTKLNKKQVGDFFDALAKLVQEEVSKKGPGSVTLPNLLKVRRAEKKATKARQMKHPQTGEPITIPAKPKQTVVRARILKTLQDSVKK